VARNEFRSDLYYRLNVFPICVPPLRERRDDIPALVTHFVKVLSRRMGKRIETIPTATMAALESYSWPGNIRELQNLIERAVILANDGVLRNPVPSVAPQTTTWSAARKTVTEMERVWVPEILSRLFQIF
jgi:formate hydrogenlyase transcriptional activator